MSEHATGLPVSEFMRTALRTAYDSEPVDELVFTMKLAGIHHLPVLDAEQRLVGIVSHRDLCAALANPARSHRRASEVMSKQVVTASPDTPAADVIRLMIERSIGCVPIVSERGTLAGIVTETDFLRLALERVADGPR